MDTLANDSDQARPPRLTGFDPVRCLGRGGQGQVWLMNPRDGSTAVAAKFFTPPNAQSETGTLDVPSRHNESQITQEWRLLSQFKHEHLIPVHRLVTDAQGGRVLIMDYAAGGSLGQIVRSRGPLTVGETVTILTPLGQVLAFLHSRGAVHGDVSAGNVVLSSSGKPYLSDFGCSSVLGQEAGEPAGTAGFYCPTDTARDEAADVYALAAVGWYALTGRAPALTSGRTPLPNLVPDVPGELVAALEAGLQEDPSQRPSAAAVAQAVFRSARAEAVILSHAVHPSVLPELPTRRVVQNKHKARSKRRGHTKRWFGASRQALEADVRPLRKDTWYRRHRKVKGLEPLWGNEVTLPKAKPRAGIWVMALAGLAGLVVAFALVGGDWLRPTADAEVTMKPAAVPEEAGPPPWAAALPAQIRLGLMSTAPEDALPALAWARSFALSNADQDLLAHINTAYSPALAADTAIVSELDALGHGYTGLEFTVEKATKTATSRTLLGGDVDGIATATVRATIITSAFAEQDEKGALVHNHAKEQRQELNFVLTRSDARWTIQQVVDVAPAN